ncbi:MAG TPA: hypothetical protein VG247_17410 [Pseudonocardiaceae bacterium]|jgi:hypothetical protein|nr:hypothetical protein [Pseudonocardiaceae bacterium]
MAETPNEAPRWLSQEERLAWIAPQFGSLGAHHAIVGTSMAGQLCQVLEIGTGLSRRFIKPQRP